MTQADFEIRTTIQKLLKSMQDTLSRFGPQLHPEQRQAFEEAVTGLPAYLKEGACEGLGADRAFVTHVGTLSNIVRRLQSDLQSKAKHSRKHR